MTYAQTMEFINSFGHAGAPVKDLSRMEALLSALENPHRQLKFIHIAGTNGKGSTLTYCAESTIAAGICTGMFTSPYILCYEDRIRVNGENIPREALCRLAARVAARAPVLPFSQFEITLAIALLYFLERGCELVFLEVGIGGLLDATNVVDPLVSVITSISLDHTALLGNTVEEIAAQKAGILKPHRPAVLAPANQPSVCDVIRSRAEAVDSLLVEAEQLPLEILRQDIAGSAFVYGGMSYELSMPGLHQIHNAMTALCVLQLLRQQGYAIPEEAIRRGLLRARVPARIQVLSREPLILLDGGHNPDGTEALGDTLQAYAPKPIYGVVGLIDTKDYLHAVANLEQVMQQVYCVDGFAPNAVPASVLASGFARIPAVPLPLEEAFAQAVQLAGASGGTAVICGSLYLASRFMQLNNMNKM